MLYIIIHNILQILKVYNFYTAEKVGEIADINIIDTNIVNINSPFPEGGVSETIGSDGPSLGYQ